MVSLAREFCVKILKKSRCKGLPFHDVWHTLDVYEKVNKIGKYYALDQKIMEPLLIAALFHDTGMSEVFEGHEDVSSLLALNFLQSEKYPKTKIDKVLKYINATKMPQNPNSELEAILCDADLFHLSSDLFFKRNQLLRKEWKKHLGLSYTDGEWRELNIKFLQQHTYHTSYGATILEKGKQRNIEKLFTINCK
ncbi:HD domain-containing protein [Aquimarina latercula]|uniref:HD domain-containing protein n=1 Tax=Aquimarina latercula TaxID=987 RepID=UPI0004178332|nr:HD domain-containing protein [Aquimarina latercula]